MRAVTEALEATTGHDLRQAPRGIDGCSIPTYAIPLDRLALAFARIGTGTGLRPGHARAATRLMKAVARHPFMAAGSDRFDTAVIEALGERVYCKVGAEAVFCASFPSAASASRSRSTTATPRAPPRSRWRRRSSPSSTSTTRRPT
jgi:L-asparaginase II